MVEPGEMRQATCSSSDMSNVAPFDTQSIQVDRCAPPPAGKLWVASYCTARHCVATPLTRIYQGPYRFLSAVRHTESSQLRNDLGGKAVAAIAVSPYPRNHRSGQPQHFTGYGWDFQAFGGTLYYLYSRRSYRHWWWQSLWCKSPYRPVNV